MANTVSPDESAVVLAVDFDGTMHADDLSILALRWLLRHKPLLALKVAVLLVVKGKAAAKLVMEEALEAVAWLPMLRWHGDVLDKIAAEKAQGRNVVVVTGSTQKLAARIVKAKGLGYEVIGTTDPRVNLVASGKAALLMALWGEKGFDYVGNSNADLKVWAHARKAAVVGAPAFVRRVAKMIDVAWAMDPKDL